MNPATPMLELKHVSVQFGGIKAVTDLSLQLFEGEILALIGPNGAGKTTAFNIITGVYQPTAGELFVSGEKISDELPHQITARGLARTFQNIRLFKDLSVRENILVSLDNSKAKKFHQGLLHSMLRPASFWADEAKKDALVDELLKVFGLDKLPADTLAKNLPYGAQRRLEIARAIATGAKVLLLDEPAAGMNGNETAQLMGTIRHIREHFKVSILLIEHDMKLVMGISERIIVLEHGRKIAEGLPKEIQNNPAVIRAYLGTGSESEE